MNELVSGGMLVFDCDGTILPKVEDIHALCVAKVIEKACSRGDIGYSQFFFDQLWNQELGRGIQNFFKQYAASLEDSDAPYFMKEIGSLENAERLYEDEYIEFAKNPENRAYFKVRNGLIEVFQAAVRNKTPIAVLSNAKERVLRQSLTTGLIHAGMGGDNLSSVFSAVVGKDMVEADGNLAKPHPSSVLSVKQRVEMAIGFPISLQNSIGFGDTPADYKAFKDSGIGRIVACDNERSKDCKIIGPDQEGFVVIGQHHNAGDVFSLFTSHPSHIHRIHHHQPIPQ